MIVCAPLAKSPNCASQTVNVLGSTRLYPYSNESVEYSDRGEFISEKVPVLLKDCLKVYISCHFACHEGPMPLSEGTSRNILSRNLTEKPLSTTCNG